MRSLTLAAALSLIAGAATAHEFVVVPDSFEPNGPVTFEAHSTHVFFEAEEAEALDSVSVQLVASGKTVDASLEAKDIYLAGQVAAPDGDLAWLVGHRHAQVWSRTPEGWKRGGRNDNADAVSAGKFEKFSKVLLSDGGGDYAAPLGHALEIVPLQDPAAAAAGDTLPVHVLYNGAPIPATVTATFGGFSSVPNTYAFVTDTLTEGEDEGQAMVRLWSPGVWMVRVEHEGAGGDGYDRHVLRATLVFDVEG